MKVTITTTYDVDVPTLDDLDGLARAYMIHEHGEAEPRSPLDQFEQAVLDSVVDGDLGYFASGCGVTIRVDASHISATSGDTT